MQLHKRAEAVIDIQLPMHVLAQAMPFIQVFITLVVALLSHLPSAAVGLYIKAFNPGAPLSSREHSRGLVLKGSFVHLSPFQH